MFLVYNPKFFSRSEYCTVPPLVDLNKRIDNNGDVFVDDFVVGREGYGKVKFYGRTNVAGLNLDEIGENFIYSTVISTILCSY